MFKAERPPVTTLVEYQQSDPIRLSISERDALAQLIPGVSIMGVEGEADLYRLNPGSNVGAVQLGDRRFELRPKLGVRRLMFLMAYSMDPKNWLNSDFDFEEEGDVFEAVIPGFAHQLETALRLGLLAGYRQEESALQTVRGQIRFGEQIRSRFGLIPPIECRYDEFSEDIEINRILKAAIARLGEIRIKSADSRLRLRELDGALARVSSVRYDPLRVPEVRYDRLNEHFKGPTELARLILKSRSIDSSAGGFGGSAFLVDLATIFEDFVVIALREALRLSKRAFPQHSRGRFLYLDEGERLRLKPDISWWHERQCIFIGDVKYKRTPASPGVQHPDMYQLLAYTTATRLPKGMLIYAAGDERSRTYRIPMAQKEIEVLTLELDCEPEVVLKQIETIARLVRMQAAAAYGEPKDQEPLSTTAELVRFELAR